jgi:hypothetical protein
MGDTYDGSFATYDGSFAQWLADRRYSYASHEADDLFYNGSFATYDGSISLSQWLADLPNRSASHEPEDLFYGGSYGDFDFSDYGVPSSSYDGSFGSLFGNLFEYAYGDSSSSYDALFGGIFDSLDGRGDTQGSLVCVSGALERIDRKISTMVSACEAIGLASDGTGGEVELMGMPSLDLASIGSDSSELFERFCYEQTDCKDAYKNLLSSYATDFRRCFGQLPESSSADLLTEVDAHSGHVDNFCPALTHRLVANFPMSGTFEEYDIPKPRSRSSGRLLSPPVSRTLRSRRSLSSPAASSPRSTSPSRGRRRRRRLGAHSWQETSVPPYPTRA